MKFSYDWIKKITGMTWGEQVLSSRFTMVGLEVEYSEPFIDNPPMGIVAGKIIDISPLADSSNLLVKVDVGNKTVSIVCGAHNISVGDMVPVVLPGGKIAGGIEINEKKFGEVVSEGMLCSEKELGLYLSDNEGIMILYGDFKPGDDISAILGFEDVIMDVSITPNRADCLSVVGISREVAAMLGRGVEYLMPEFDIQESGESADDFASVSVADRVLCPKYFGRVIRGVKIAPSPSWMQVLLTKMGMRPINNVVDITNYVMLELGQPLHAFDLDKLSNWSIIVRHARPGERLTTLDGKDRALDEEMLIIADTVKPVAIAGVMGGADSEVSPETVNIFLESALFDAASVRKTAKKLELSTEASYRFERGIDPLITEFALDRAAYLIALYAGGSVASGRVGESSYRHVPTSIYVSRERINSLLGVQLSEEDIFYILDMLNFKVKKEGDGCVVTVPSYRLDVSNDADIVEEIGRFYGYDKIPFTMPKTEIMLGGIGRKEKIRKRIQDVLISAGMNEAITYSFIDPAVWDRWGLADNHYFRKGVMVSNPLSVKQSFMRTSLLPGLLDTIQMNFRRGRERISIFEYGKCFYDERDADGLPEERRKVAAAVLPYRIKDALSNYEREFDFYDLKGVVELLLSEMGVEDYTLVDGDKTIFSPSESAMIVVNDKTIGAFGKVHDKICGSYELPAVYAFELDVDMIDEIIPDHRHIKPIPRYPSVKRDIAVVVPENVKAEDIKEQIVRVGGELLERVELFDVYRGKQVPSGHRSLAFSMEYRLPDRTLTEEEVASIQDRLITLLNSKGYKVRRG